ncbi:hypothetical protein ACFP2T_16305 [Plantactinospora solaniradicis]|uniref:Carbohydrate ABC transporter permease n=1 Tax=Plantactinospora solaniradicis TaxID=1723736 RepID=A0ABW1KAC6_9ACTN
MRPDPEGVRAMRGLRNALIVSGLTWALLAPLFYFLIRSATS